MNQDGNWQTLIDVDKVEVGYKNARSNGPEMYFGIYTTYDTHVRNGLYDSSGVIDRNGNSIADNLEPVSPQGDANGNGIWDIYELQNLNFSFDTDEIMDVEADGNYYEQIALGVKDLAIDYWKWTPGDADKDGSVGFADFLTLGRNFGESGKTWEEGDFNGDGQVSFPDFLLLRRNWSGRGAAPTSPNMSRNLLAGPKTYTDESHANESQATIASMKLASYSPACIASSRPQCCGISKKQRPVLCRHRAVCRNSRRRPILRRSR